MQIELKGVVEFPIKLLCQKCGGKLSGKYDIERNAIIVQKCHPCTIEDVSFDPRKGY